MITPNFQQAYAITEQLEGGFSDHPNDRGGLTMWGITESVARAYGYTGAMKDMPQPLAKEILKFEYWDRIKLDKIDDDLLAQFIFDASVNHGQGTAVKLVQKAYNVLSAGSLKVDGIMGSKTLSALNQHPEPFMLKLWFLLVRGDYYRNIVNRDSSQRTFIKGWTNRLDTWFDELYECSKKVPEVNAFSNVDQTIEEIIRRLSK
jgi:lysozyme family protein